MKSTLDGGEAILEACRKLGVDYILSSPGTEWAPVWEAMAKQIPIADLGSSVTAPIYIARLRQVQQGDIRPGGRRASEIRRL